MEGFFYILKRDSVPRYRLLLRNQADNDEGDFIQSIDDNLKFEVKEDTFFYQYVMSLPYMHQCKSGSVIMAMFEDFGSTTRILCQSS